MFPVIRMAMQTTVTDAVKSAKAYSAWDPMFNKIQGAGTIYNTLFPLTNMNIFSVGASVNPLEDVTASLLHGVVCGLQIGIAAQNPLVCISRMVRYLTTIVYLTTK